MKKIILCVILAVVALSSTALSIAGIDIVVDDLPYADYAHEWVYLGDSISASVAPAGGYATYWFSWTRGLDSGKYAIVIDDMTSSYVGVSTYSVYFTNVEYTKDYVIFDWTNEETNTSLQMHGAPPGYQIPIKVYLLTEKKNGFTFARDLYDKVFGGVFDFVSYVRAYFDTYIFDGGFTDFGSSILAVSLIGVFIVVILSIINFRR